MRCNLAFSKASDGRLLVAAEVTPDFNEPNATSFTLTPYEDDQIFIMNLFSAKLDDLQTTEMLVALLAAISKTAQSSRWVPFHLTPEQVAALGLDTPTVPAALPSSHAVKLKDVTTALLQSPTPFALLHGRDHVISFINSGYLNLLRRSDVENILGRPARKALPEFADQPFFELLDRVYETSVAFIGSEVRGDVISSVTGELQQAYFDLIYHPVEGSDGSVWGILCQGTDVTERVLDRQIRESREDELFRQWAELEAIYRGAPLGMCLIDVEEFRIKRVNEHKAQLLGSSVANLIGRKLFEVNPALEGLRELYMRAAAGEVLRNISVRTEAISDGGRTRLWLLNLHPLLDPSGKVSAISSISVEVIKEASESYDLTYATSMRMSN